MKKIKDLNKWRDIPCSWIGNHYIVKIAIFPINTTQSLSKFQLCVLLTIKFIWHCKRPQVDKMILERNGDGGLTHPKFKTELS